MLEVPAALEIVLRAAKPLRPTPTSLTPAALGRVLAEDVRAERDSPPFTKALMDGFAVRAADCASGAELRLIEEVAAGAVPTKRVGVGEAVAIFTGAPMPDEADTVVIKERTELLPEGRVRINEAPKFGQHILPRGREMQVGDVVLPTGTPLGPAALGLLAGVGRTTVAAFPSPRVAVLATGDELVEADATPGPGQIRNSNGPMLVAQATHLGASARALGIARDDAAIMTAMLRDALGSSDVVLLAGGVSAGKFDLVPDVLRGLGMEAHFHHVRMKPGKPLLFGTCGDTLVFGLPGNPVSSFVCFELFVRPALRKLAGHIDPGPARLTLPLSEPLTADNNRPTYHPAQRTGTSVRPLPWFGSADLRAILLADAFIALPPGAVQYNTGQMVEVVIL